MAFEHKEGMGSLFSNDKKGNDKAPGMRGTIMISGMIFELAGWERFTSSGDKMFSLSAKLKTPPVNKTEVKQEKPKPVINPKDPFADFDDNVPF